MRRLLITIISNWLCFLIIGELFPTWLIVANWKVAFLAGLLLGLVNVIIKPILTIITLPLHILTLGLFAFVINAIVLFLTSSFIDGITIPSFWPYAFLTSLAFAILNWVLMIVLRGK
ncbi:MAG TPA: phage holin family protein [Caldisericia bacterium]|jgi:putative membrane protein|nr:phage holin family protein [Caldisericia bacterium]HXK51484.1 phage holin family protein [Caldisericia bacterium]